jgi:anaerobic selenocysteine-containing dehydrogenase
VDVFADLCRRTGSARPGEPETADALAEAILGQSSRSEEIRRDLRERGIAIPDSGERPVQFGDVFPRTGDRKVHLFPEELDREAPEGLYAFRDLAENGRYPLALISPASDGTITSTLGELRRGLVPVAIHPDDAAARGVRTGERVRVFNDFGEIVSLAEVTTEVRRGVAKIPKGIWARHTENGKSANTLVPDTLADLGGGACFNDARVEIERMA